MFLNPRFLPMKIKTLIQTKENNENKSPTILCISFAHYQCHVTPQNPMRKAKTQSFINCGSYFSYPVSGGEVFSFWSWLSMAWAPYPAVFRACSLLCAQGSLLLELKEQYVVLVIGSKLETCKANILPVASSLQLVKYFHHPRGAVIRHDSSILLVIVQVLKLQLFFFYL